MDVLHILFEWILFKPAMLFFDNFGFIEYALYGVFVVVLFFLLQMFCCFKLKKTALKFIPLYLITPYSVCFLFTVIATIIAGIIEDRQYDLSIHFVVFVPPLALALLGIGVGWLVYRKIVKRRKLRCEALKYEKPIGEINNSN